MSAATDQRCTRYQRLPCDHNGVTTESEWDHNIMQHKEYKNLFNEPFYRGSQRPTAPRVSESRGSLLDKNKPAMNHPPDPADIPPPDIPVDRVTVHVAFPIKLEVLVAPLDMAIVVIALLAIVNNVAVQGRRVLPGIAIVLDPIMTQ